MKKKKEKKGKKEKEEGKGKEGVGATKTILLLFLSSCWPRGTQKKHTMHSSFLEVFYHGILSSIKGNTISVNS